MSSAPRNNGVVCSCGGYVNTKNQWCLFVRMNFILTCFQDKIRCYESTFINVSECFECRNWIFTNKFSFTQLFECHRPPIKLRIIQFPEILILQFFGTEYVTIWN